VQFVERNSLTQIICGSICENLWAEANEATYWISLLCDSNRIISITAPTYYPTT